VNSFAFAGGKAEEIWVDNLKNGNRKMKKENLQE
jgi:hypothetical protein